MILLYMSYVIALGLWTFQAVGKRGEVMQIAYILLIFILFVLGIFVSIVFRHQKNLRLGPIIALFLANLGSSIAYRTGTKALYGYYEDLGYMVVAFTIIYGVVRYTKLYQTKVINLLCMVALPVILMGARLTAAKSGGAYLDFCGLQIFGLVLMGYPFVAAAFMAMPEKYYLKKSVKNLSFNLMGLLLYTFLLFIGCALCKEFGLLLVLAMTATTIFLVRCKNGTTKLIYCTACVLGAWGISQVASHVGDRVEIWLNLEKAAVDPNLRVKAETTLYLFRHVKRMGWWGNGIGNLSKNVYTTLNSDHVIVTLLNDYGTIITVFVVLLGAAFVRWMLCEKPRLNVYDSYLNLSCALVCGFILIIHVASNLGSFITAGLGFPWVSNGSVTNLMFTILMAIHCGIMGREGKEK